MATISSNKLPSATCRIKRVRRTNAEKADLRAVIRDVLEADQPMTLRGLFYQLVSRGAIDKTEQAYGRLSRDLCQLRNDGVVPWEWVLDNTRSIAVPITFSSTRSALRRISGVYRRDPWDDQPIAVFAMSEKDAIGGVLSQETERYAVPLATVRGFSSQTFLHDVATWIIERDRPVFIYYFGDHDPSGLSVSVVAERTLRDFAPLADITFERLAVTPEQIVTFNLPTRPTKQSDSRSKGFIGESVEVDALPMAVLRRLLREAIERHLDSEIYAETMKAERADRAELAAMEWREGEDDDGQ